ncbi:MAG: methyltransferase domain-containing protein [Candidatus Aminicenantes bacterium]|nr:methyltransferase domain-containing protein [Candidatus Aminicenantes bacterium]
MLNRIKKILTRKKRAGAIRQEFDRVFSGLSQNPLDPALHKKLADLYGEKNQWVPAISEYRTAISLGDKSGTVFFSLARAYFALGCFSAAVSAARKALSLPGGTAPEGENSGEEAQRIIAAAEQQPDSFLLHHHEHNQYYRLRSIADHLEGLFKGREFSLLDVGGGLGFLSLFLPEADYVLAEPGVNRIDGAKLPFADEAFDVVVSCHVLEHIPPRERPQFLDALCAKSKRYVILLNPFAGKDSSFEERMNLIIEKTGYSWAQEHLECSLPTLEEVTRFAEDRNYKYKIVPNGNLSLTTAYVFLNYFAGLAGKREDLVEINRYFNEKLFDKLDSAEMPTAYLVELDKGAAHPPS